MLKMTLFQISAILSGKIIQKLWKKRIKIENEFSFAI